MVATGRPVHRETVLPGAVLARVASSHLRVGSFQYARATGDVDLLRRLADHRDRPAPSDAAAQAENRYLALFEAVVAAQASLVAQWMLVGFVHGVMNTDNMTISGETIDYGPCAFMEAFDPATVYSSIDAGGRYAYGNQPVVAEWNLARFAEALLPLIHDEQEQAIELAVEALQGFRPQYSAAWPAGMRAKLGLPEGWTRRRRRVADRRPARPAAGRATSTTRRSSARWAPPPAATPTRPRPVPGPGRLRRLAQRWLALDPDADGDGPGEPGLHPPQPPRRGGARRRDRTATSARSAGCSRP